MKINWKQTLINIVICATFLALIWFALRPSMKWRNVDATLKLDTHSARIHLIDDDGREVGSVDLPDDGLTVRIERAR